MTFDQMSVLIGGAETHLCLALVVEEEGEGVGPVKDDGDDITQVCSCC